MPGFLAEILMKNAIAIAAACFLFASGLAGCAEIQSAESFITSPQNQATIAVLAKATVVIICDISAVATVTTAVEQAAQASSGVLGTTGKVAAASASACTGLGGLVAGSTTVPAGTPVVGSVSGQ
jgi:hypothetical protein